MTENTTHQSTQEIPYGYCHCGCGQKTKIAPKTRGEADWIKGEPLRYVNGHQSLSRHHIQEPNPSGLCMCGCGQPAPIAEHTSIKHGRIAGKPVRFCVGHAARVRPIHPPEERFWQKLDKRGPDECWLWLASDDGRGYGAFWDGERLVKAHRFSYTLEHGPIPDDIDILHRCDNPPCCNPAHLFAGTAKDNSADMMAKGRFNKVEGEHVGSAVLTNEQVRQFREEFAGRNTTVIAYAIFKEVPYEVMRNLLHGHTYRNA